MTDPCVYCGESTAFGFGRFVNRIPVDDGWGCAECSGFACVECEKQIYLDAEASNEDGDYFHRACLPLDKHATDCYCDSHD